MSDPALEQTIHAEMNRFRGKMAGFIEAMGLDDRQERGAVSTMKTLSYEAEKSIIAALNH